MYQRFSRKRLRKADAKITKIVLFANTHSDYSSIILSSNNAPKSI